AAAPAGSSRAYLLVRAIGPEPLTYVVVTAPGAAPVARAAQLARTAARHAALPIARAAARTLASTARLPLAPARHARPVHAGRGSTAHVPRAACLSERAALAPTAQPAHACQSRSASGPVRRSALGTGGDVVRIAHPRSEHAGTFARVAAPA